MVTPPPSPDWRRARRRGGSGGLLLVVVLVVAAEPHAGLVAAEWRAVEPLIHAPQDVDSAPVRRVGVENDAVLKSERAHTRSFTAEGFPVRADERRAECVKGALLAGRSPQILLTEVVPDGARLPFLLGVR